jgi:hypothetical protein
VPLPPTRSSRKSLSASPKVSSTCAFKVYAETHRILGEPKIYDVKGASGKNNRHFFCGNCGSSLYTKLDVMPGVIVIKAGGLDDQKASLGGKVDVEFYCKDRVPYLAAQVGAKQESAFGGN